MHLTDMHEIIALHTYYIRSLCYIPRILANGCIELLGDCTIRLERVEPYKLKDQSRTPLR